MLRLPPLLWVLCPALLPASRWTPPPTRAMAVSKLEQGAGGLVLGRMLAYCR